MTRTRPNLAPMTLLCHDEVETIWETARAEGGANMLAEFRGVPKTAAGAAERAKAEAMIGRLGLGAGVLVVYWQGGDTFRSWLLSHHPPANAFGAPPGSCLSTLEEVCAAFQRAGVACRLDA